MLLCLWYDTKQENEVERCQMCCICHQNKVKRDFFWIITFLCNISFLFWAPKIHPKMVILRWFFFPNPPNLEILHKNTLQKSLCRILKYSNFFQWILFFQPRLPHYRFEQEMLMWVHPYTLTSFFFFFILSILLLGISFPTWKKYFQLGIFWHKIKI